MCHTLYGCVDWNSFESNHDDLDIKSHPVWVCGLKPIYKVLAHVPNKSHPVWVCGLKLNNPNRRKSEKSHTLYGCVDWNLSYIAKRPSFQRHTLYGCVDWNDNITKAKTYLAVTPGMGVWIETRRLSHRWRTFTVIPCMGVWIETPEINLSHSLKTYRVSSLRSNFNSLF